VTEYFFFISQYLRGVLRLGKYCFLSLQSNYVMQQFEICDFLICRKDIKMGIGEIGSKGEGGLDSSGLEDRPVAGSCEHDNESLDSITF
jgi:hypothetical protein